MVNGTTISALSNPLGFSTRVMSTATVVNHTLNRDGWDY